MKLRQAIKIIKTHPLFEGNAQVAKAKTIIERHGINIIQKCFKI